MSANLEQLNLYHDISAIANSALNLMDEFSGEPDFQLHQKSLLVSSLLVSRTIELAENSSLIGVSSKLNTALYSIKERLNVDLEFDITNQAGKVRLADWCLICVALVQTLMCEQFSSSTLNATENKVLKSPVQLSTILIKGRKPSAGYAQALHRLFRHSNCSAKMEMNASHDTVVTIYLEEASLIKK